MAIRVSSAQICTYDIERAFYKCWIEECLNDVVDTLPESSKNDKVSLLFELNKKSKVSINTPYGLTYRIDIDRVLQQGGSWGPILCSNSVDTVGKREYVRDKNLYLYKDSVKIPCLSYIDDALNVSKCGHQSIESNVCLISQL